MITYKTCGLRWWNKPSWEPKLVN